MPHGESVDVSRLVESLAESGIVCCVLSTEGKVRVTRRAFLTFSRSIQTRVLNRLYSARLSNSFGTRTSDVNVIFTMEN